MRRKDPLGVFVAVGCVSFSPALSLPALAQSTTRVSISTAGAQGDNRSVYPSISAEGRFVAFDSRSNNLVPDDTNDRYDVFVHDRWSGTTTRVSVDSSGVQADGDSQFPSISPDGRWVTFRSAATNLASGGRASAFNLFLHDRQTGDTRLLSTPVENGIWNPNAIYSGSSFSSDGRLCLFENYLQIVLLDLATGIATPLAGGFTPAISGDGRTIAFTSDANDLVPDDTNGHRDAFVLDLSSNAIARMSTDDAGLEGDDDSYAESLSFDGRFVTFFSYARNLVPGDGPIGDVFVHDRDVDGDGVFDEPTSVTTTKLSVDDAGIDANGVSWLSTISADGRFVAFYSRATNLDQPAGAFDGDVFIHDRDSDVNGLFDEPTGTTTRRVDVASDEQLGNGRIFVGPKSWMSADGRFVAFGSEASNLVPEDTNRTCDVFVRDRGEIVLESISPATGSDDGDDLVHLEGRGFDRQVEPSVQFGGVDAEIVEVSATRLSVKTPRGTGVVDVRVATDIGAARLPSAFTFVSPALAARYGNVNVARGDRENVLFVNASPGDEITRETRLPLASPIAIVLVSPSSRETSRFALYAWRGEPDSTTRLVLRRGIGSMVFPTPLDPESAPQPFLIANDLDPRLGESSLPTRPAPTTLGRLPGGLLRPTVVTLQGIIQDDGSRIRERVSITNALILHVE